LPAEELLNRLEDMIKAFDEAKDEIKLQNKPIAQSKFPRHKGKDSTKSVRFSPRVWKLSEDSGTILIKLDPVCAITMYPPDKRQLMRLDTFKQYDMSITLRPGRNEEGFEQEDVYYLSFVEHRPVLY